MFGLGYLSAGFLCRFRLCLWTLDELQPVSESVSTDSTTNQQTEVLSCASDVLVMMMMMMMILLLVMMKMMMLGCLPSGPQWEEEDGASSWRQRQPGDSDERRTRET